MNTMETSSRYTPLFAVLCDDVRREISGKDILIGVYADAVLVDKLPAILLLTMYLRIMVPNANPATFNFRVVGPGGSQITPVIVAQIPAAVDPTVSVNVVLQGIPVQMQAFGKYLFQWEPIGQQWETLTTMEIRKGDNPPPGLVPLIASTAS